MKKYTAKAYRTWYGGGGSGSGPTPSGCCYELITVAALQALAAANNMVQGTFYQITDVTPDWQVVMLAESGTELSTEGQGIFQNSLYVEAYYILNTNTLEKIYDPLYKNSVSGSANIITFPWNQVAYNNNEIDETSSIVSVPLFITSFSGNKLLNNSSIDMNGATVNSVDGNTLNGNCNLDMQSAVVDIVSNNFLYNGSSLNINNITGNAQIFNNTLGDSASALWNTLNLTGSAFDNEVYGSTMSAVGSTVQSISGSFIDSSIVNISGATIVNFTDNKFVQSAQLSINSPVNLFIGNTISQFGILNIDNTTITSFANNLIQQSSDVNIDNSTIPNFDNNSIEQYGVVNITSTTITDGVVYNYIAQQGVWNIQGIIYGLYANICTSYSQFTINDNNNGYIEVQEVQDYSQLFVQSNNIANWYLGENTITRSNLTISANASAYNIYGNTIIDNSSISFNASSTVNTFTRNNVASSSQIDFVADAVIDNFSDNTFESDSYLYAKLVCPTFIRNLFKSGTLFVNNSTTTIINSNSVLDSAIQMNGCAIGSFGGNSTMNSVNWNMDTVTSNNIDNNTISGDSLVSIQSSNFNEFSYNETTSLSSWNISGIINSNNISSNEITSGSAVSIFTLDAPTFRFQNNVVSGGSLVDISDPATLPNMMSMLFSKNNITAQSTLNAQGCKWNNIENNTLTDSALVNISFSEISGFSYNNINSHSSIVCTLNTNQNTIGHNTVTAQSLIDCSLGTISGQVEWNHLQVSIITTYNSAWQYIGDNSLTSYSQLFIYSDGNYQFYQNKLEAANVQIGTSSSGIPTTVGDTYLNYFGHSPVDITNAGTYIISPQSMSGTFNNNYIDSSLFNIDRIAPNTSVISGNINFNRVEAGSQVVLDTTTITDFAYNQITEQSSVNMTGASVMSMNANVVQAGSLMNFTNSTINTSFSFNLLNGSSILAGGCIVNVVENNQLTFSLITLTNNLQNGYIYYCRLSSDSRIEMLNNSGGIGYFLYANDLYESRITSSDGNFGYIGDNQLSFSNLTTNGSIDSFFYNRLFDSSMTFYLNSTINNMIENVWECCGFGNINYAQASISTYSKNYHYNTQFNIDLSNPQTTTISTITGNVFRDAVVTLNNTLLAELSNNEITSNSTLNLSSHNNPNGTITSNIVESNSTFTLTGNTLSTYAIIQANSVSNNSLFSDNALGDIKTQAIEGNTLLNYATLFVFQNQGNQLLGNVVQAGTLYVANNANCTQCNFNHILRANLVLGNGVAVSQVRSNHLVGPTSGTYANLTLWGTISIATCEGNNIFNAGRIEAIYTVPTLCGALDWNMVSNTSAVLFTNTQFGRFGGAIIGDRGGNVIQNGSTLIFTGGSFTIIADNTWNNRSTLNYTNSIVSAMRENQISGSVWTMTDNTAGNCLNNVIEQDSTVVFDGNVNVTFNNNSISEATDINLIDQTISSTIVDNKIGVQSTITKNLFGFLNMTKNVITNSTLDMQNGDTVTYNDNFINNTNILTSAIQQDLVFTENNMNVASIDFFAACNYSRPIDRNTFIENTAISFNSPTGVWNAFFENNTFIGSLAFLYCVTGGATIRYNTFEHSALDLNGILPEQMLYNTVQGNSIIICDALSEMGTSCNKNTLTNQSAIQYVALTSCIGNQIDYNILSYTTIEYADNFRTDVIANACNGQSLLSIFNTDTSIVNNNNLQSSLVYTNGLTSANINNNQFWYGTYPFASGLTAFNNNRLTNLSISQIATNQNNSLADGNSYSTFRFSLDLDDPAVWNGAGVLTLTTEQQELGGIFLLYNAVVPIVAISTIVNFTNYMWVCRFYNSDGSGIMRFSDVLGGTIQNKLASGANIDLTNQNDFVEYVDNLLSGNQYEYNQGVY